MNVRIWRRRQVDLRLPAYDSELWVAMGVISGLGTGEWAHRIQGQPLFAARFRYRDNSQWWLLFQYKRQKNMHPTNVYRHPLWSGSRSMLGIQQEWDTAFLK